VNKTPQGNQTDVVLNWKQKAVSGSYRAHYFSGLRPV